VLDNIHIFQKLKISECNEQIDECEKEKENGKENGKEIDSIQLIQEMNLSDIGRQSLST